MRTTFLRSAILLCFLVASPVASAQEFKERLLDIWNSYKETQTVAFNRWSESVEREHPDLAPVVTAYSRFQVLMLNIQTYQVEFLIESEPEKFLEYFQSGDLMASIKQTTEKVAPSGYSIGFGQTEEVNSTSLVKSPSLQNLYQQWERLVKKASEDESVKQFVEQLINGMPDLSKISVPQQP